MNFDAYINQEACKRHVQYKTLKKAVAGRRKCQKIQQRLAYVWACEVCGFYHVSKIKEGTDLHKNMVRVNKKGELQ